jgi:hypothetical protein
MSVTDDIDVLMTATNWWVATLALSIVVGSLIWSIVRIPGDDP